MNTVPKPPGTEPGGVAAREAGDLRRREPKGLLVPDLPEELLDGRVPDLVVGHHRVALRRRRAPLDAADARLGASVHRAAEEQHAQEGDDRDQHDRANN